MTDLSKMVELTDAELDVVAAGNHRPGHAQGNAQAGLVNVGANVQDVEVNVNALNSVVIDPR